MKENKKEFLKLYYEIKNKDEIDNLYMYDCLRASGFDKDMAYDLLDILYNLWLKDELNLSVSILSDLLYENINNINIDNMSTRKILGIIEEGI